MGTRLYPLTERTDLIERIAGVPQGTTKILEELKQKREVWGTDAWYDMMDDYPDAMRLYDFQLFGFGKLNTAQWDIAISIYGPDDVYNGGYTKDKSLVREMLNNVDSYWKATLGLINIEDLDGVGWN